MKLGNPSPLQVIAHVKSKRHWGTLGLISCTILCFLIFSISDCLAKMARFHSVDSEMEEGFGTSGDVREDNRNLKPIKTSRSCVKRDGGREEVRAFSLSSDSFCL